MAKTTIEGLAGAIEQTLTTYHESVVEKIDAAGDAAVKRLVKLTRATAPEGARKSYKRHIASKRLAKTNRGSTHVWYVKEPDHRLTHLLVHGHATKNGGRTKPNPFLKNALDQVLPEYENAVKEAIKT
jgi:hypothetical protein